MVAEGGAVLKVGVSSETEQEYLRETCRLLLLPASLSRLPTQVAAGGASDTGWEPALLLSISSPITCLGSNFLRPLCSGHEAQSEESTPRGAWLLPLLSTAGPDRHSYQTSAPSQCPYPHPHPHNHPCPLQAASVPALYLCPCISHLVVLYGWGQ